MNTKVNSYLNAMLVAILGVLGFGCDRVVAEYGVPSADFTLEGEVTNESKEPLKDIQIVMRRGWTDNSDSVRWEQYNDTLYSGVDGRYYKSYPRDFPLDHCRVIANDPSGVYESDTIDARVSYSGGDGHWYEGEAQLTADFVLKRFK